MSCTFLCNGPIGYCRGLIPPSRTAGIATPIPSQAKKKSQKKNWALIFTDEASFRQDSTLHVTWSRVGHPPEVPVTGQRKSVKILGATELWKVRFHYQRDSVFNAETYLAFLKTLARHYRRQGAILIHDSASYHKKPLVQSWLDANEDWLEVHPLPKYSPELNPTERFGNTPVRTARMTDTLKMKGNRCVL